MVLLRPWSGVTLKWNKKTFQLFSQFFSLHIKKNQYMVKEGDVLELGEHTLEFFFYSGVANLLEDLSPLGLKNRKVAIIENNY